MFGDLNKVTLLGNVTNEPELRFTSGGTGVLNFSVATNRNYKSGEEWKDEATFHNLVVWRSADQLAKRIKKGTRVLIEGRIQTRTWEGTDGKKNYKTEVVADDVILIARYEGGKDSEMSSGKTSVDGAEPASSKSSSSDEEINPDDLPF